MILSCEWHSQDLYVSLSADGDALIGSKGSSIWTEMVIGAVKEVLLEVYLVMSPDGCGRVAEGVGDWNFTR